MVFEPTPVPEEKVSVTTQKRIQRMKFMRRAPNKIDAEQSKPVASIREANFVGVCFFSSGVQNLYSTGYRTHVVLSSYRRRCVATHE